jgi:hypothetical protein
MPKLSPGAQLAAMRKTKSGGRQGRKRSDAVRCPCQANTLTRATARNFDCCKKALGRGDVEMKRSAAEPDFIDISLGPE